ncbi:2457_t:CDS:2, partial [Gigaspora rosea]
HNEWDRSSFNINSELPPEQLNQVVDLLNEVPQDEEIIDSLFKVQTD